MQRILVWNASAMHSEIEYRGYTIFHDGHEFVAEPKAADDTLFEIGSQSIELVTATIDEMLGYLDATRSASRAEAPPAWFQTWIDNGAAGRVRIAKPQSFEFEHLNRRKPRPKRRSFYRLSGLISCLAGLVMSGYAFADVDGDGKIDSEDLATLIDNIHMISPRRKVVRTVEFDGQDYLMTAVPSKRDDCDFHIKLVAAGKVSL
jgi:hypothetical protein